MQVPAARYRVSVRPFPERLPPIEYPSDSIVRRVQKNGLIYWHHHGYFVGEAFHGLDVALRPTVTDDHCQVFFCQQQVATLDLKLLAFDDDCYLCLRTLVTDVSGPNNITRRWRCVSY